jgi:beta-galactosidase
MNHRSLDGESIMSMVTSDTTARYAVQHLGWPHPERIVLPEGAQPDSGVVVSNRSLLRDGQRWIPTSGEIHYSRLDRRHWALALQLMRAGGINLVSTYVFWNHHQPLANQDPDFTGNRDISAFLELCAMERLPAVIRIGPWCHGEVRNGGLPDWIQNSGTSTRSDDPRYLALVNTWFEQLASQIGPWCGPGGPIVAIQLENELYDNAPHIATLKGMAQQVGIRAPIWTATGWGNAQLPLPEVFPVYSGYSEGFWVDAEDGWDDSFRSHYFFSDRWDDPGVGKDLAGDAWTGAAGDKHPDLPPATCELAGGMASAYHRRPVPSGLDVAALANVKLGSGSAWQGYYMFAGGTNPDGPDGLQESHATGYPNDLPRFNYDFHAPLGRDLRTRESFHRLRLQHAFLAAFQQDLAGMTASFPSAPDDDRPLRWSLRSDGSSGYVFINNHQPVEPLGPVGGVQFDVQLDRDHILFPCHPVEIPAGAILALPIGVTVAGLDLRWATINLVTLLEAEEPVLVGHAHPGLDPEIAVPAGYRVVGADARRVGHDLVIALVPGVNPVTLESPRGARLHLLTLDPAQALNAWTPVSHGRRRLVLSAADIIERDGSLVALVESEGTAATFDAATRTWTQQVLSAVPPTAVPSQLLRAEPTGRPTSRSFGGRASAPTRAEVAEFSARYRLSVDAIPADIERAVLVIDLIGDVAELTIAGQDEPFDDVFWDGEPWTIDLTCFAGTGPLELEVRVTSFNPGTSIWLTPEARSKRNNVPGVVVQAAELRLSRAVTIA